MAASSTSFRPGNVAAVKDGARSRILTVITAMADAMPGDVSIGAAAELHRLGLDSILQFRAVDQRYRSLPAGIVDTQGRPRSGTARYIRLCARAVAALAGAEPGTSRPLLAELHTRLRHHLDDLNTREPTDPRGRSKRWTPVYDGLSDAAIAVLTAIRRLDGEQRGRRPDRRRQQEAAEAALAELRAEYGPEPA